MRTLMRASMDCGWPGNLSLQSSQWPHEYRSRTPSWEPHTAFLPFCHDKGEGIHAGHRHKPPQVHTPLTPEMAP